jgi:hypothetical protein
MYIATGNYGEQFTSSRIDYLSTIIATAAFDPSGTWIVTDANGNKVAVIRSGATTLIH